MGEKYYCDALSDDSIINVSNFIYPKIKDKKKILILCIGTDNCLGDSFGPLTGTLLKESNCSYDILGDLENIIDLGFIKSNNDTIKDKYKDHFIIALDACLGDKKSIGKFIIEDTPLIPASALCDSAFCMGNVSIKAVVNKYHNIKYANLYMLQQTRLFYVYSMANNLAKSLLRTYNLSNTLTNLNYDDNKVLL